VLDMDLAISVYNSGAANAERDRRRGRIDELIAEFEGRVGDIIGGLTAATTDLQAVYGVVAAQATNGGQRGERVAAAADCGNEKRDNVEAAAESRKRGGT